MSKLKRWIVISVVLLSIGAVSYMLIWYRVPKGMEVKTAVVKRGDMSTNLSTSGTIQSKYKKDYFVLSPSKVSRVYVKVGDSVIENELLIKLDAPDRSFQLKQAYIQLDMAKTTLESLKNKKLYSDEMSAIPVNPDISVMADGLDDQIKLQEKQVEMAALNVDSVKHNIYDTQSEIKSGLDGMVTAINTSEGNMASVGIPVITVEDIKDIKAMLDISQYDALKIKQGQEAVIRLGPDGKSYTGMVTKINPAAKKNIMGVNTETVIPVEVDISEPDDDIKIGFDADVEITTGIRKDVLFVPYESVMKDKESHMRVYTVEKGKAVLKDVTMGVESDFYVEIKGGLHEGDIVVLNPPSGLKEGSSVLIK